VLAQCFGWHLGRAQDILWAVGFSLLTGLLAQWEFRLPYSPVPLTGQTFAVLLSGALLGSRRGFQSQMLYLAQGAAGLPVFAGGAGSMAHLLGPSGGYLWSFPLAAAVIGWLVERGASRRIVPLAGSLFLADALILLGGVTWLSLFFHVPIGHAVHLGFFPFLAGDVAKIVFIGLSLPQLIKVAGKQHK